MPRAAAVWDHDRMRSLGIVALLAGSATAGPVLRGGVVGGYDTSAPGHREDGLALGAGYHLGPVTAELDYAYLDYDTTEGIGGGASQLGVLLQAKLLSLRCRPGSVCQHVDLDLGIGRRWVTWQPGEESQTPSFAPATEHQGRMVELGISFNFALHFALHYVAFDPDRGPQAICRGECPMQVTGSDHGVLFEISLVIGS